MLDQPIRRPLRADVARPRWRGRTGRIAAHAGSQGRLSRCQRAKTSA